MIIKKPANKRSSQIGFCFFRLNLNFDSLIMVENSVILRFLDVAPGESQGPFFFSNDEKKAQEPKGKIFREDFFL
ncbi:hypothetical protein D5R40_32135 [Okeania hirsuta]|uniref:Uncharacterized protein n=1 Tax=Okeania hirsuta TaxID=1458930 RepID=A0A3N6QUH0_9CYAN|nr:hypothetical protein D5R40_32135 [Okeania hirsuta]